MRLCFIGDSFVNGTGDDECLGWAGRLCRTARTAGKDVTYYNLGVRRDTSADIAVRWRNEAMARLPPLMPGALIFSFGVNDCVIEDGRRRIAPAETLHNAGDILAEAKVRRRTLMIGPPPPGDAADAAQVADLSQALARICADLDVRFLPVFDPLSRSAAWRAAQARGDGAHPDAAGYAEWAALVGQWPAWHDIFE